MISANVMVTSSQQTGLLQSLKFLNELSAMFHAPKHIKLGLKPSGGK